MPKPVLFNNKAFAASDKNDCRFQLSGASLDPNIGEDDVQVTHAGKQVKVTKAKVKNSVLIVRTEKILKKKGVDDIDEINVTVTNPGPPPTPSDPVSVELVVFDE
jgi:hypothetical protein